MDWEEDGEKLFNLGSVRVLWTPNYSRLAKGWKLLKDYLFAHLRVSWYFLPNVLEELEHLATQHKSSGQHTYVSLALPRVAYGQKYLLRKSSFFKKVLVATQWRLDANFSCQNAHSAPSCLLSVAQCFNV